MNVTELFTISRLWYDITVFDIDILSNYVYETEL